MKKLSNLLFNKESSGFTLLELTIVFTIVAALGSIGFAAFTNFSSQQVLDQAAQDLKSGIDQAKFSAISRIKPTGCSNSNVLDGYIVVVCATGGSTACLPTTNLYELRPQCIPAPVLSPVPLSKNKSSKISVIVSNCGIGTNNTIVFSSQTGTSNGKCTILLTNTDTNATKLVCVDNGGNASIQTGSACP